jgi:hypothetical protein
MTIWIIQLANMWIDKYSNEPCTYGSPAACFIATTVSWAFDAQVLKPLRPVRQSCSQDRPRPHCLALCREIALALRVLAPCNAIGTSSESMNCARGIMSANAHLISLVALGRQIGGDSNNGDANVPYRTCPPSLIAPILHSVLTTLLSRLLSHPSLCVFTCSRVFLRIILAWCWSSSKDICKIVVIQSE